jgi:hypothetical protein
MFPPPIARQQSRIHSLPKRPLSAVLVLSLFTSAWGAINVDQVKAIDRSTSSASITSPLFSTTSGNELLLAFISTDANSSGILVNGVSGGGLTWALVRRTNAQLGTAEVWSAFAGAALVNATVKATLSQSVAASMTVMTFTGTDTSGVSGSGAIGGRNGASASSGAPAASLTTTRSGSLVLGVGNDWDTATLRTAPANQTIVHEYQASVGDCYWVQRLNAFTQSSSTTATINDTAPTTDQYNLTVVEVLPAPVAGPTFAVSGSVTPADVGTGATLTLSQNGILVATATVSSGTYTFPSVANGTYTLTAAKPGVDFTPSSQPVTVAGAPVSVSPAITASLQMILGSVTPATLGTGASVALSQNGSTLSTGSVDINGNYSFSGVTNGTYTLTPSKVGVVFNPASQNASPNGANFIVPAFSAFPQTRTAAVSITPTAFGMGTLLTLDGTAADGSTVHLMGTAGSSGTFNFTGLQNGTYTVTPGKDGYTFNPVSQTVNITNANATVSFVATAIATYKISGTVSTAADGSGTLLTLSGTPSQTTTADTFGTYNFPGLGNSVYSITPSKTGFTFNPPSLSVTVSGADVPNVNFTAQAQQGPPLNYPDLSDILPTSKISIVSTGSSRIFQYTHDTFDGGTGPLVIQPVFNPATGNYQGNQYIYSLSAGKWTLARQIPVAGVFIFDSDHGHFHFPFTTYGLYTVASNGAPGTPVAISGKVSFCINDSFIYDPSLPNAGALGNLGSCSDPTSLRGLNIGAVDEYDQTDAGQAISLNGVPDGTYWLRAIVDPNNFLAESDKTNNETDIELTMTGNTVQVLKTVTPTLNNPPSITLTSPQTNSTITKTVQLTASTANVGGVQFLIDGQPFGSAVSTAPYAILWDTTTVPNGTHWLAAQTTDATGVIGTSSVVLVTVSNGATSGPTVQVSSPANGSILSSTVTLYATAGSSQDVSGVNFYVDLAPVGNAVLSPPYMISWDSSTVKDGQHSITASAIDTLGNVGNSLPVTVTVDNSRPALPIGKEASLSVDGTSNLTTQAFSTRTPSDLLVAFVAYDGPAGSPQTATVSGAGLSWTLLERSNTQSGTAEIWLARADGTLSSVTVMAQPGVGSSYHGSLTVIAFTNAAGTSVVGRTGAPSAAPDIALPGVIAGDWVFAVGNDWDNAVARTPVAGQALVHQKVDAQVGDTYWVQSTSGPSTANALVDIHDSAPTSDQWNYAAVEVVASHQ